MQLVNINSLLEEFNTNIKEVFFVQIGSNNGKKQDAITDFIGKYRWKGILIEPVSYLFEQLNDVYNDNTDLVLVNAAIANNIGFQTIYRLKNDLIHLPDWYDGLASLDKNIILSHGIEIENIDKYIVEEKVNAITFSHLLDTYQIAHIDILHIDVEGFDFEIIKMIDFMRLKPKVIIYEFCHLTVYNYYKSIEYLQNFSYVVLRSHNSLDMIAIDASLCEGDD